MRLFFAIGLSELDDLWSHLGRNRSALAESGYRITQRDNLHLTVHFIGESEDSDHWLSHGRGAAAMVSSFSAGIGGPLLALPSNSNARVLAYGVRNEDSRLVQLAAQLSNGRIGNFLPHATVARRSKPGPVPVLPDLPLIQFRVKSFCLMRSELTHQGAVYSIVEEFRLR